MAEGADDGAQRPRDWRAELRARGYRLTPQRELVLEAVDDLDHARPEDILAAVRERASGVNMSTIYRTLELLEDLGLVTHAHLGHGAPAYHTAFGPTHAHLRCGRCGRIEQVEEATVRPLAEAMDRVHGFAVDVAHLTVSGLCADCRRAEAEPPSDVRDGGRPESP